MTIRDANSGADGECPPIIGGPCARTRWTGGAVAERGRDKASRREVLAALVSAAALGGFGPGAALAESAADTSAICGLAPVLRRGKDLRGFVEAFFAEHRAAGDRQALLDDLLAQVARRASWHADAAPTAPVLVHALRGAIDDDLAAGRTHRVDGWVFARTEVALAVAAVEVGRSC